MCDLNTVLISKDYRGQANSPRLPLAEDTSFCDLLAFRLVWIRLASEALLLTDLLRWHILCHDCGHVANLVVDDELDCRISLVIAEAISCNWAFG